MGSKIEYSFCLFLFPPSWRLVRIFVSSWLRLVQAMWLCRGLDQAGHCLSAAKGGKNEEQRFEEVAKGKYERTRLSHRENHRLKKFCSSLHLK